MTSKQIITCIMCPVGCRIQVTQTAEGTRFVGAGCIRGREYALQEITTPSRVVITVVPCVHGDVPTVAVKTTKPVPKDKMFTVMKALSTVTVSAPVQKGDVLVHHVAGLPVDVIATRSVKKR